MKKRLILLMFALLLLSACAGRSPGARPFEVGTVRLISNGAEHEPHIYHVHAAFIMNGSLVSASGIPFEAWLNQALNTMPEIPYADDLQVVIEGEDGEYQKGWAFLLDDEEERGITGELIPTSDGRFSVLIPDEPGTYLLFIDVTWSRRGPEYSTHQYVFKIVR